MGWVVIWLVIAVAAQGQYQVFSWESFEGGVLPNSLQRVHGNEPGTVTIYDYLSPDTPPEMRTPRALAEVGRYGLRMRTIAGDTDQHHIVSLAHHLVMDRALIGPKGRALFQADVFLPEEGAYLPSPTMLAYMDSAPDRAWIQMYRFGMMLNRSLMFSYSDKDAGGKLMKTVPQTEFPIKRPGWHRIQIIFQGQDQIHCAVDGVELSFSPLKEPSLRMLRPGFMVASAPGKSGESIIDNLSIQWTPEEAPLPESPWIETTIPGGGVTGTPASSSAVPAGSISAAAAPATSVGTSLTWGEDPDAAWAQSQQSKRPILMVIYVPRARDWQYLEELTQTDPAARQAFSQFVLLKVNANTLRGGLIAKQFGVFKAPTMILLGTDGQSKRQMIYSRTTAWGAVAQYLQGQ
jgi:hypothetical protein